MKRKPRNSRVDFRSEIEADVTRRRLLVGLSLALPAFNVPLASFAQAPAKVWRIGVLHPRTRAAPEGGDPYSEFFSGMRNLGYIEGRNLAVHWRTADSDVERLPELAADLVRQKVDVIVTTGTPAVSAARQATTTIPIIALLFAEPVASGFAASLARPGGNITGLSFFDSAQMVPKRVEILAAVVSGVVRFGYLANPDNPPQMRALPAIDAAVRKLGKEIVPIKARTAKDLETAFDTMSRERIGALVVAEDSVLFGQAQRVGALALKRKLPTLFPWDRDADAALLVYRDVHLDHGLRAAALADKIFKGVKPGDLPIEQPTGFNLVVNLRIAKALGIKIPQSVLLQASRVIE